MTESTQADGAPPPEDPTPQDVSISEDLTPKESSVVDIFSSSHGHDGRRRRAAVYHLKSPKTRKSQTQQGIAFVIMGSVLGMYLVAVLALVAGGLDVTEFKEVAIGLAGPLGLATAVAGFLYGSQAK